MEQQYVIETCVGPVQLLAPDDTTAVFRAKAWLKRCGFKGYDLFRYPLYWVEAPKNLRSHFNPKLIWVPLFALTTNQQK